MTPPFSQGLKHNKGAFFPDDILRGLAQNGKMCHKKVTLQLLSMFRCKYTTKPNIELRLTYSICEILFAFDDLDARDRMRNNRGIEMLTSACFSILTFA